MRVVTATERRRYTLISRLSSRQDRQCFGNVSRYIEFGREGEIVDLNLQTSCRVGPKLEGVGNSFYIRGAFENRAMPAILNNLGETVRARSDDRLPGRQGFQTGVRKRIVEGG